VTAVAWHPASEDVAAAIRRHIRDANLQPGDRLGREIDLAERFGVSRATLREALRLLASEHLVRAVKGPGGGIFVAESAVEGLLHALGEVVARLVDEQAPALEDLIEARRLFEVPVAGMVARRATPEEVERLRGLAAEAMAAADDPNRFAALDGRLHAEIATLAGNPVIGFIGRCVASALQPLATRSVARAVVEEVVVAQHHELVEAIARGDQHAAEEAMREHLAYVGDLVGLVGAERERPAP
jgi:DNA-binding FadR family transcriptional regulator